MNRYFVLGILILALIFGLSSMSQSYATARQAQVAIEASRVAQIASVGNLVALVTVALVIVATLVTVVLVGWLFLRGRSQAKRQWTPGPNAQWGQVSQPQANALLPALLTVLLYQMMQNQQQHFQESEQFWMLNEPADDTPAISEIP
jgi:ABC-type Fe3+ transport system permease subunit